MSQDFCVSVSKTVHTTHYGAATSGRAANHLMIRFTTLCLSRDTHAAPTLPNTTSTPKSLTYLIPVNFSCIISISPISASHCLLRLSTSHSPKHHTTPPSMNISLKHTTKQPGPDQPSDLPLSHDQEQSPVIRSTSPQPSLEQPSSPSQQALLQPHQGQSSKQPSTLWIELLPLGVQYRIAEYVCEGVSGLDALNLAKTTSLQRHAVSVALDYLLIDNFATHAQQLVEDWMTAIEDVRVLELWEHPKNFHLLASPHLAEVVLEDEPMQLEALTQSRVHIRRIEFYARYGTPTHIIVHMFENVAFNELELDDIKGAFFETVDVEQLANACEGLEKLVVSTSVSNQDAVADFVNRLPTLCRLMVVIEGVEISFAGDFPKKGHTPNVTGLGLYINKVKWFESFALQSQLKELWLMSDQGWGENEVLQFSCCILDLPELEDLTIKLRPGSERFFPKISSLEKFHAFWNGDVDLSDGEELYYKPEEGVVMRMIEGMPLLTNLELSAVRLSDHEVVEVIKNVGHRIEVFGVSTERQDVPTMERLLTIVKALTKYTQCLEDYSLCLRNERGVPVYDPCVEPITTQRKKEMLLHLDRLHRHAPKVPLGHVETSILDWPEEDSASQQEDKAKEAALQDAFTLRRCRRGMNENGDPAHMWTLAKLLETGCEGLPQDLDAATELYKQAVWMGDPGDAILNLWRVVEDANDKSTEPRPNGAFELVLELDKAGVKRLPLSAEIFLKGTESTESNPAAAAKLLQLAVDRGLTDMCCLKLGNLVRAGYNDVPPDPYKAFDLYLLAIQEHSDPDAMFNIAEMLKHGYGNEPPNPAAAHEYLERGVRLGWAPCMNDLAVLLKEGYEGVPPDSEAALELYKRATADGNTVAMSNLASFYVEQADGDVSTMLTAIELYEQSISEGQNPHAMLLLGAIHERGYCDIAPNPARAKELYVQAIEWGDCMAYTYLANLVGQGYNDISPDPDEAIRLYQLAIDTADKQARVNALCAYGHLMTQGHEHVKPDPAKAVELYRMALDDGEKRALFLMAELYEEGGPGMEPDPAKACLLYTRAIEEGMDTDAMRKLGDLLERGYGEVAPNPHRAVELYRQAIEAGDMRACFFLGDTLEGGYGDELPNPEEAAEVYRRGVDAGDPECMCALGSLLERGYPGVSPDPLAAIDLYNSAIDEYGSTKAMRFLGMTLEEGFLDNPPDYQVALELYEVSARIDPWSKLQLAKLLEEGYDNVEPDFERARDLCKEVIEGSYCRQSKAIAMRRFGRLIERTCEDDPKRLGEAAAWYRRALDTYESSCCLYDLAALLVKGYGDIESDVPQAVSLLRRSILYRSCCQPFFLLADCVEKGYGDVEADSEEAKRLEEEGCMLLWERMRINVHQ